MATLIKCPRADCANNQAGQCDMGTINITHFVYIKSGPQQGLYLLCRAFEKRGAA